MHHDRYSRSDDIAKIFIDLTMDLATLSALKTARKKNHFAQKIFSRLAWFAQAKLESLSNGRAVIARDLQSYGERVSATLDELNTTLWCYIEDGGKPLKLQIAQPFYANLEELVVKLDTICLPAALIKNTPRFAVLGEQLAKLSATARKVLHTPKGTYELDIEMVHILDAAQTALSKAERRYLALVDDEEEGTEIEIMAINVLIGTCIFKAAKLAFRLRTHSDMALYGGYFA